MSLLVAFALSLALHLTLGWAWTVLAGVAGGWLARRRGWLVGLVGVGGAWLALVGYSFLVAPMPTRAMAGAMGGIMGNLPGWAVVALTLLIGLVLGGLGGGIGSLLPGRRRRTRTAARRF